MYIKVLDPELYVDEMVHGTFSPKYPFDAGIDLRARVDVTVHAGSTEKIPLGVATAVPDGCVGWLTGRSRTCLDFGLITHEGKIDAGYRGEIHAFVSAQGSPVKIARGDRIAQLVVVEIRPPIWRVMEPDEKFQDTVRGEQGLGSTGRR